MNLINETDKTGRRIILITQEPELPKIVSDAAKALGADVFPADGVYSLQGCDLLMYYEMPQSGMDLQETAEFYKLIRTEFDVPMMLITREGKVKIMGSNWPPHVVNASVDATVLLNTIETRPNDAVDYIVAEAKDLMYALGCEQGHDNNLTQQNL